MKNNPFLLSRLTLFYPITVILLALAATLGWIFDIEEFKKILPDAVSMNPISAVLFLCCAFVLLINFPVKRPKPLAWVFSSLVVCISLAKVLSYLIPYQFGLDQFLFSSKLQNDTLNGIANEMAPNTAINFFLVGFALLTYRNKNKWNLVSDCLSLVVAFNAFISLLGYLYDARELYGISHFIPMAVPTAISFLLISTALMLNRKNSFFLRILSDSNSGGRMARYLLPMAFILPVIFGLLRIYAQHKGYFTSNFGTALFSAFNILIFVALIVRSAYSISKSEKILHQEIAERKNIEEKIRASEMMVKEFNKELEKKVDERTQLINRNRNMFRSLIENSIDAIMMMAADSRIQFSSVAIEKFTGYRPEDLLNKRALDLVYPEDKQLATDLFKRVLANPGLAFSSTLRILNKDGELRWVEGTVTNLLEDLNVNTLVGNFHDITEKRKVEERRISLEKTLLHEKIEKQIQITEATIHGQEKERKEIGMELHDNVNQILSTSLLYLSMAETQDNSLQYIAQGKEFINHAIQEIRKLSRSMVPPNLGAAGIIRSIRELTDLFSQTSGLKISLSISEELLPLDPNKQLALYRIIQEQLNNILKHAKARNAMVTLSNRSGMVQLVIKDDGQGFDLTSTRQGIGINNIQSRVEMLQGNFEIQSSPGHGCQLKIELPLLH